MILACEIHSSSMFFCMEHKLGQFINRPIIKITVEGIGSKEMSWSKGSGRGYQTFHNVRGLSVCALLESGIFSLSFFFSSAIFLGTVAPRALLYITPIFWCHQSLLCCAKFEAPLSV